MGLHTSLSLVKAIDCQERRDACRTWSALTF